MSAYSSLDLAANRGVRTPTKEEVQSIFRDLGFLVPEPPDHGYGNLANEINAMFADPVALASNNRFFCPDTIIFASGIEVASIDGNYVGSGWHVSIHGNGFLHPWNARVIKERILQSPKFLALREQFQAKFGGRFVLPRFRRKVLREQLIDAGDGGWAWFLSESM